MKKLLEFLAFLLIAQGVGAVAHHFFGWFKLWGLVHRIGFLSGYEVFAGLTLVVLGVAVGGASEKVARAVR